MSEERTSIVIPIYNAEKIVASTIRRVISCLEQSNCQWEILLRDDCSRDKSRDILGGLVLKYSKVKVFYNEENKGLGYTLRRLFESASHENIIYLDCDLPFSEKIIDALVRELKDKDIAVASRYHYRKNHVPWNRRVASRLYCHFCKLLFNISVKDIGSGSFALRKKILPKLNLAADGFDVHVEIYVKAKMAGLSVFEIPSTLIESKGTGSFRILKHGPGIFVNTIKMWYNLKFKHSSHG